eukprot:2517295-Ditylum_brightwellii.AAC.1
MVHARDRIGTDGTVLFNDDDDSVDGADKHLAHLSQAADCCLIERSEQNKHVVCNEANDVDNGVDNNDNDSDGDGDDDGVDNGAEGADKHLEHFS